ncbi:amidase [bacterium]|nr:amidase [bacterium]
MSNQELCFLSAVEMAGKIRNGDVSCVEVMEAHLAQIERINPQVNAVVTLHAERALDGARAADAARRRGDDVGPLHGLPIAHKDTIETKGIRTTWGSPIFRDHVPARSALIVDRLHAAGAIPMGKTNVPEFGAGSQTFNSVFGATRNPHDLTKTCGGSSGGAAVALACGMQPIADGSDMGGSLRNPANFCNVVGFRPSPGRVPVWPSQTAWATFALQGPLARTVEDVALLMQVMAGPDPRSPIALPEPGSRFADPLQRDFRGVRIAWTPDLGELPVDPRVADVIRGKLPVFEDLGCTVDATSPDFSGADEIFKVWRAWTFHLAYGKLLEASRDQIKETVIWNIEAGAALTGPQIGRAEAKRSELYQRMRVFMEEYEFLILPVNQVPPFSVDQEFVSEINTANGLVPMETYIDWMKSCYYITVTGHPAISVPCGFTEDGLPVGVQIVGRHQDDFGVLQLAYALQQGNPSLTLPAAAEDSGRRGDC